MRCGCGEKEGKGEALNILFESKMMEQETVINVPDDAMDTVDAAPTFAPLTAVDMNGGASEYRKIPVPPHRLTPLRKNWENIYTPIVTHMKLQIRFNTATRHIELKTSPHTEEFGAIQKGEDFIRAFLFGFDLNDAIALLRLDDLFIDTFEIDDVKMLKGDHLSRAIGRIAGKDGKTKFAIENATRTRIVLADKHVHILGSFNNIKVARDAVVSLILGSPPGTVCFQPFTFCINMNSIFQQQARCMQS